MQVFNRFTWELSGGRRKIEARITAGLMEEMESVMLSSRDAQMCSTVPDSWRRRKDLSGNEVWMRVIRIEDGWGRKTHYLLGSYNQWQARYSQVTHLKNNIILSHSLSNTFSHCEWFNFTLKPFFTFRNPGTSEKEAKQCYIKWCGCLAP